MEGHKKTTRGLLELTFRLGNESNVYFWEDAWMGNILLSLFFEDLYAMAPKNNCLVAS